MYRKYINRDGLGIMLPESVWLKIQAEVASSYPNECGGVFTGKVDLENRVALIDQVLMPSKKHGTPVFFTRFAKRINKHLEQLFKTSRGKSYYLGEWHSHPDGSPNPSSIDFHAMHKIANNNNISINTPLMLIVGYDKHTYNEQFFIFSNNMLTSYERQ